MKILSADQIKTLDQETIRRQGITSLALMERAAQAVVARLKTQYAVWEGRFVVLCGAGNNGGDGLAIARMLYLEGHEVAVYVLKQARYSADNLANQKRWVEKGKDVHFFSPMDRIDLLPDDMVIDALFGVGLSRPLEQEWNAFFGLISDRVAEVVSIDVPSGLFCDRPNDEGTPVMRADVTYTFQAPKLSLLQPDNALYSGEIFCLDIGLDTEAMDMMDSPFYYTTLIDCQTFVPKVNRFAHKGTFGHVLVLGGSYGKIGAVVLCSKAALRAGCGLVSVYTPACGYSVVQSAFPEAMVLPCGDERVLSGFPTDLSAYQAFAVGPGLGTASSTTQGFREFIKGLRAGSLQEAERKRCVVLDADALNMLSADPSLLEHIPEKTILTPHPKELSRLIGHWTNDFEKLEKVRGFAQRLQAIVIVKGANTAVVFPNGEVHFNSTGNPGMATGGAGDVLTGIIASLAAQGFTPEHAAVLGVFLHGRAGDLAADALGTRGMIAGDIVAFLQPAWKEMQR